MSESLDLEFVDRTVAERGTRPEALIAILQSIQEHYGYLPEPALQRVCETTEITPAAITGVSTFYDTFELEPSGKHRISVCHGVHGIFSLMIDKSRIFTILFGQPEDIRIRFIS